MGGWVSAGRGGPGRRGGGLRGPGAGMGGLARAGGGGARVSAQPGAGVCAAARAALRGPRRGRGQVIGFYFKLHFVLAEVGRGQRRGPEDDYISIHT